MSSTGITGTSPSLIPATAILATLLLDERHTFDQHSSQRIGLKKTLISHGGIAPQIQTYFQRLETRNYRVTSVVDDTHSPPRDKRLPLLSETGPGRDSGIEDGRQSSVSSFSEPIYMQTTLVHKEFSVYKHALLCAQYPVLGRNSRPNSTTSNVSSAHFNPQSPHSASSQSPRSFRFESEDDEDGSEDDYPIQTETLSAVVRSAFQLSEEKHLYYDKNIMEGLGWKAPAKVLVEELVSRLAILERNIHPYYQIQAFELRDAYDVWQQQDRVRISELINKFWFFSLPSPASSLCKPSYWESMHDEYTDLMHKLIRCDKNQATGSRYLLSSASRRLLKEFGLRYGVGELYRRIVYLVYLAEQKNFESELYYVDHVSKKLAGLRDLLVFQQARFTMVKVEFDMLYETLTKLHNHCENWLQRLLQDTRSPQKVAFLANLLCSVLELKVKVAGRKQPPVETFMEQYLQESLKEAYHSHKLRLTTELNLNAYTVPVSAEMTNKLIINIRDEVTRCRQCYNDVFSRFHLDVTELATVTLYNHLMLDVLAVCKFAEEQAQGPSQIDQDLLALAYKLSQLDQEWRAYIPTHAQQWRQPVMLQTKRWLSHLTRDLTTMVLGSANNDKFQMLEISIESALVLPSPPTMGPHLSQRICQSPRSAFNSFQARDRTSPLTSTPQVRTSSGAGDTVPDQHKIVIVAEVYATEVPQNTCEQVNSASQTKRSGHEVADQRGHEVAKQSGRAELKEFLLKNTEIIIRRTTSAPDLEWCSQKETKDQSQQNPFVHLETNVVRELESRVVSSGKQTTRKKTIAPRGSGFILTSSQDSGVDKDRYGSQDESDLDSMHPELVCDGGRARRNWHGRGALNDGKFTGHNRTCEEPTHDLGICIEVDSVDDEDKMMTRSGSDDICVATDDDEVVVVRHQDCKNTDQIWSCDAISAGTPVEQFWDAKSQTSQLVEDGGMQDVGTLAAVVLIETKIEHKNDLNIAKPTKNIEETYQYNDYTSADGVDNPSTNCFISIPAMEQDNTCIDKGHIDSTRASSKNDGTIDTIQEISFKSLDVNDTTQLSLDQRVACDVSPDANTCITPPVPIMADIQETPVVGSSHLIVNHTEKAAIDVHSQSRTPLDKAAVDVHNQSRTPLNTSNAIISGALSPASNASADLSLKTTVTLDQESSKVNTKMNSGSSLLHPVTDLPSHVPTSVDQEISNISPKINSGSSLLQASKDLQTQLLPTSVLPHSHSTGHSSILTQYSITSNAQNNDDGISNKQPFPIPSMHSTPVQRPRLTNTQTLEDSITASLVLTDVEEEPHNLAVSSSIVDVLVMVQQMVSFVCELCLILCPLPGTQEVDMVGPAGKSHSAVLCSNRAMKMREELLNSITETLANTIGLYVQNLLAIDLCASRRDDANRLLSSQITEDLEERKRLGQLGKCRHDRAGTDCYLYLHKEADLLCDAFEPITQEMCVRINNTWCLSCLVPCFQGLFPKGLLHQQNVRGSSEILDDLTFDLTPHGDVQYIRTIMETQVKLLAHKLSMFLCRGLEVLMSDEMSGCCMSVRLQPITDCLSNHLTALSMWLYPPCYQLFANQLWQLMIENFESEVRHLVRYNEKADDQALLLLQGLTHLIEHLHHAGKGLSIDDLVDPAEPVLQLLQLFTLSTKRLIQLHKKLFRERSNSVGPSSRGLTNVMPRDKLQQMFKELHKKRKCFTGKHLRDWIIENCIIQDQDGVDPVEQADDVAWRLLEMGVISPVTKSGNTPLIKQGEVNTLHRLHSDTVSPSSQSDTDFPPVTVHSITHSGYTHNEDSSTDQDSKKSRSRSRHSSTMDEKRRKSDQSGFFPTVSQLDGITSPCSSDSDRPSSRSSTSTFCIFRPDHTHFYCFSDIDDEVFYGIATRVVSQAPSPLHSGDEASAGQSAHSQGYASDSHLKVMSITPEFVLGIIYARRKQNQEAAKYVKGLPADTRSDVEAPVSAFWFCLSACP